MRFPEAIIFPLFSLSLRPSSSSLSCNNAQGAAGLLEITRILGLHYQIRRLIRVRSELIRGPRYVGKAYRESRSAFRCERSQNRRENPPSCSRVFGFPLAPRCGPRGLKQQWVDTLPFSRAFRTRFKGNRSLSHIRWTLVCFPENIELGAGFHEMFVCLLV